MQLKSADVLKIARRVDKGAHYHTITQQIIDSDKFEITKYPLECGWNKGFSPPQYGTLEKVDIWNDRLMIQGYTIKGPLAKAKKIPGLRKAIASYLDTFKDYTVTGQEFKEGILGEHGNTFEPEIRSRYAERDGRLLWRGVEHDLCLGNCKNEEEVYRHVLGVVMITDSIVKAIETARKKVVAQHVVTLKDELAVLVKAHKEPKRSS